MAFRLIHRTNHQGLYIHANVSDREDEVPQQVIWTQAIFRRQFGRRDGCCRSFGRRIVYIDNSAFTEEFLPDTDTSNWHLHFVNVNYGYESRHTFLKFLVSPCDHYDGLKYLGKLRDASVIQDLALHLIEFCNIYDFQICSNAIHLHVGLEIPQVRTDIDTREAEDEYYEEIEHDWEVSRAVDEAIESLEYDRAVDKAIEQQEQAKYEDQALLSLEYDRAVDKAIEQQEQDKYEEEVLLTLEYDRAVDEAIEQHEQDKYEEELLLSLEYDRAVDEAIEQQE